MRGLIFDEREHFFDANIHFFDLPPRSREQVKALYRFLRDGDSIVAAECHRSLVSSFEASRSKSTPWSNISFS